MFDELVESSAHKTKTNRSWGVLVSAAIQVLVILVLILIPLICTQALPTAMLTTMLVAPPPPPPPPPPPGGPVHIVKPTPHFIDQNKLMTPRQIPKQVQMVKEDQPPADPGASAGGVPGGVVGGVAGGVLGGVLGGALDGAAPPPPPPPPAALPKPSGPVKIGGQVQDAKVISRPLPVYPLIAKDSRISGAVVLHAIIGKDGSVSSLQVVSGNQLLVQSAVDAVRQWRYQPTLLNGDPVEVDTTITVNFVLGS